MYRPGTANRAADALSRHSAPTAVCSYISTLVPAWLSAVLASYTTDLVAQNILSKLALDPAAVPQYSLHSGILRYRNKIWIGNDPTL